MGFAVETDRPGLRNYARTVRKPKLIRWYGDLDLRSAAVTVALARQYHLSPRDLRKAVAIVREGRSGGRYLATLPRSGTNWLIAMICCGFSIDEGNEGVFHLNPDRTLRGDDEWVFEGPRHWWPALPASLANAIAHDRDTPIGHPVFLACHDSIEQGVVDHSKVRPVVTVREPIEAATSLARMVGADHIIESGQLERTFLRVPDFFRRWEARIQDPDVAERTLILRYEDMRTDPVGQLVRIDEHWSLGLDRATWERAAELCSWSAMAAMAESRPDTTRISLRPTDLPPEITERIAEVCEGLGSRFGYGNPS